MKTESKQKRKKIGLALGSGGWRGLAHVGVIKTLIKHKIPIDYIAGSSAGALIGGMYAAYENIDKLEKEVRKIGYRDLFSALSDPRFSLGIIRGDKTIKFLKKYLGNKKIEKLKIPFCAVATNLSTSKPVEMKKGDLAEAIRASISVPLVFQPAIRNKQRLIDGGDSMPIPTTAVKKMGADIVIGVSMYKNIFPQNSDPRKVNAFSITKASFQILLQNLAKENLKSADICVYPNIPEKNFDIFSKFVKNKETIKYGEVAMQRQIPKIIKLMDQK